MDTSTAQPASAASSATTHAPLPSSTQQQTLQPQQAPNMGIRLPHAGDPDQRECRHDDRCVAFLHIVEHQDRHDAREGRSAHCATGCNTTSRNASTPATTTAVFQDVDLAQTALTMLLQAVEGNDERALTRRLRELRQAGMNVA